jgi:cytochrome c oxidase assembly factor CtaG
LSTVLSRLRPWLVLAAAALTLAVLLPPAGTYARQYAFAQALQFVIFAVAAPALFVVGAGARIYQLAGWPAMIARRVRGQAVSRGASETARRGVSGDAAARNAAAKLVAFMALVIVWRLPAATSALATEPLLAVLEMVTLTAAGLAIWIELAAPPADRPRASRPQRTAVAALSMWTIWIIAYVTGMSKASFPHTAALGLVAAADQQVGVAIMWAIPAICFVPVIYALAITWLGEREDPDKELREQSGSLVAGLASSPRPPRGWRLPPH